MSDEAVNKYLSTLIEEVAQLRKLKWDYDTIFARLKEKFGTERHVWEEFCTEAKYRFKILWSEGDCVITIPTNKHPTREHWKLLTKVLIMEDEDMDCCTQRAEHILLTLLLETGLDPTNPEHVPLWHVIERKYSATGKMCPAVVLQRRLVRWLCGARGVLRARWCALLAAPQPSGPRLDMQALIRYSTVIAANTCQWSQFVADGLVVESDYVVMPKATNMNFQCANVNMLNRSKVVYEGHRKIVQLDGQDDSSDESERDENGEDMETDGDKADWSAMDEEKPTIKIEFEEEIFHLVEQESQNMKLYPRDDVFPYDSVSTNKRQPEPDRGEVIPTAHLRILLSSINSPAMLATCCLARRSLLLRERVPHGDQQCGCCCATFPEPTAAAHLSLVRLPRTLSPVLELTLHTATGIVRGTPEPAHIFASTCALTLRSLMQEPDSELLCLPSEVAWSVGAYVLVAAHQPRGHVANRSRLFAFSDPQRPVRRVLPDEEVSVRRLVLGATALGNPEANAVYYCVEPGRNRRRRRLFRAYVALTATRLREVHATYDLRLVHVVTRQVLPVLAVCSGPLGPLVSVRRAASILEEDLSAWDRDQEIQSRVLVTALRKPQPPEEGPIGCVFPGPRSRMPGVARMGPVGKLYQGDCVLDPASLNWLPKLAAVRTPGWDPGAMLRQANKRLLRHSLPEQRGRERAPPRKRVGCQVTYRIFNT